MERTVGFCRRCGGVTTLSTFTEKLGEHAVGLCAQHDPTLSRDAVPKRAKAPVVAKAPQAKKAPPKKAGDWKALSAALDRFNGAPKRSPKKATNKEARNKRLLSKGFVKCSYCHEVRPTVPGVKLRFCTTCLHGIPGLVDLEMERVAEGPGHKLHAWAMSNVWDYASRERQMRRLAAKAGEDVRAAARVGLARCVWCGEMKRLVNGRCHGCRPADNVVREVGGVKPAPRPSMH